LFDAFHREKAHNKCSENGVKEDRNIKKQRRDQEKDNHTFISSSNHNNNLLKANCGDGTRRRSYTCCICSAGIRKIRIGLRDALALR